MVSFHIYDTSDLDKVEPDGLIYRFPAMSTGDRICVAGYLYGLRLKPQTGGSMTTALFTEPRKNGRPSSVYELELPYAELIKQVSEYLSVCGIAALDGGPALDLVTIIRNKQGFRIRPRQPEDKR